MPTYKCQSHSVHFQTEELKIPVGDAVKIDRILRVGVKPHEANQMISDAIDLLVQIGIRHEVRRVIAISNVAKDLKNGDVYFEPIFRYREDSSAVEPSWEKIGDLKQ